MRPEKRFGSSMFSPLRPLAFKFTGRAVLIRSGVGMHVGACRTFTPIAVIYTRYLRLGFIVEPVGPRARYHPDQSLAHCVHQNRLRHDKR